MWDKIDIKYLYKYKYLLIFIKHKTNYDELINCYNLVIIN